MIHLYAHIPFFADTSSIEKKNELVNATLDPRLHQIGTNTITVYGFQNDREFQNAIF